MVLLVICEILTDMNLTWRVHIGNDAIARQTSHTLHEDLKIAMLKTLLVRAPEWVQRKGTDFVIVSCQQR